MAINPHRKGGPDIPVTDGGTAASDAATARSNIGAGDLETAAHAVLDHTGIPGVGGGEFIGQKGEFSPGYYAGTLMSIGGAQGAGTGLLAALATSNGGVGGTLESTVHGMKYWQSTGTTSLAGLSTNFSTLAHKVTSRRMAPYAFHVFGTDDGEGGGGATITDLHHFIGFSSATGSDMGTMNDPAGAHYAGLQRLSTDTNWFFVTKDGSPAGRNDTGIAIAPGQVLIFEMIGAPGFGNWTFNLYDSSKSLLATLVDTSDLPGIDTMMGWHSVMRPVVGPANDRTIGHYYTRIEHRTPWT